MVTLKAILDKLTGWRIISSALPFGHKYKMVLDLDRLVLDESKHNPGTLYIGNVSTFRSLRDIPKDAGFILIDYHSLDVMNAQVEYALLFPDNRQEKILNECQEILNQYYLSAIAQQELLTAFLKDEGMHQLFQVMTNFWKNPIILFDMSTKVLVYPDEKLITNADGFFKKSIQDGYVPYESHRRPDSKRFIKEISQAKSAFIWDVDFANRIRRMYCPVFVKGQRVGYLATVESNRPFSEYDLELYEFFAKIVSSEMQRGLLQNEFPKETAVENILLDLLEARLDRKDVLQDRMLSFGWKPNHYFCVSVVSPKNNGDDAQTNKIIKLQEIRSRIEYAIPSIKSVYYEGYLCLLIDLKSPEENGHIEEKLVKFLKDLDLVASLSSCFQNLFDMRKYYAQSKRVLELGLKKEKEPAHLFRWRDYYFYDLLSRANPELLLSEFCLPELRRIKTYDKNNRQELYGTLYEYLLSGKNMTVTANRLYIHRNSLSHRLEKIVDLTGLNLNEGEDGYKLFISYKILELLEGDSMASQVHFTSNLATNS